MRTIKIIDYTQPEELPDSNQNPLLPQHPFRLLITGPSGCGKTNLLLNFIYNLLNFEGLFICAKNIYQPKYLKVHEDYTMFNDIEEEDILKCKGKRKQRLLKLFKQFKKENQITSNLEEFINVDDLDSSIKNLVIFDDCVKEKDQRIIEDFFIRGRIKNASIIYISQSYYSTPIDIRKNCNYFIFFELQPRDIHQIIREIDGKLTKEEFIKLYKTCIQKPHDFFMLDLFNPKMRYRKNFDPI